MKGILAWVYESPMLGDCTHNGLSSRFKQVIVIIPGEPGVFEPSDDCPALYLVNGPYGWRAKTTPNYHDGSMFGGHFVYTSDSRFPTDHPIKIFDRFE